VWPFLLNGVQCLVSLLFNVERLELFEKYFNSYGTPEVRFLLLVNASQQEKLSTRFLALYFFLFLYPSPVLKIFSSYSRYFA
jgi:hypothetical protein